MVMNKAERVAQTLSGYVPVHPRSTKMMWPEWSCPYGCEGVRLAMGILPQKVTCYMCHRTFTVYEQDKPPLAWRKEQVLGSKSVRDPDTFKT